jgi:hypothetical protein
VRRFLMRRGFVCIPFTFLFLAFFVSVPGVSLGAGPEETESFDQSQTEKIETLKQALKKQDQVIKELLQRVEKLEQEAQSLRGETQPKAVSSTEPPLALTAPPEKIDALPEEKASPPVQPPAAPSPEDKEEEERLAQATLERVLIQRSALLLPAWTLEIEPSFTYAHSSSDRVIIDGVAILDLFGVGLVVGDIVSERIRRDSVISALTFRMGLPWDFQAEARFPYRYEWERVLTADFDERTRSDGGLGDLEFALSRQILRERGWLPDLVGSFRWRVPTGNSEPNDLVLGTGFHGLQTTLSAVKASDPIAFFGGGSYTVNIPEEKDDIHIDPGDTWGYNLGLALALNPETSINFQWDHRFTSHTKALGNNIPGSTLTVGIFRVGATYALTRNLFLDLGVGIGITEDAPDVQATVALPLRIPQVFADLAP